MAKLIIFTDLDDTLLDSRDYSTGVARPAVQRVVSLGIPIIFCSSKTYVEQVHIRKELGVADPFIVENGAAMYIPRETFGPNTVAKVTRDEFASVEMGISAAVIRQRLNNLRALTSFSFKSFTELSPNEVTVASGLSHDDARRAQMRDFSETIVPYFSIDRLAEFESAAADQGLASSYGGRFITLTELGVNKGRAVRMLIGAYRRRFGEIVAVGIGNSPDDGSFYSAVDSALIVQQPDGAWADNDLPNIKRVTGVGPLGWAAAVNEILTMGDLTRVVA